MALTIAISPAPTPRAEGGPVGFVARTPSPGKLNADRCDWLARRIPGIDEQARCGQSSESHGRLKEERSKVKNEMWVLKCGF